MTKAKNPTPLLKVENLHIDYIKDYRAVEAVVDFNLTISAGQKIGLVGESGSGKSIIAYSIMNYMGESRTIRSGKILFKGRNLLEFTAAETQSLRGNAISMIYQEAMNSLNPVTTIGSQMMEVPTYKIPGMSSKEGKRLCLDILAKVKIKDPLKIFNSYPFQLSGGQQQRVVIAMAFMTEPDLLIMDEPTTSLDVTVEAEIMDLVEELVKDSNTSLLLISHNLGLVLKTCDEICVLYSGQVLEQGSSYNIFYHPQHPYTGGLFKCIPRLYKPGHKTKFSLEPIPGQLPLPWERPKGCWFKNRCSFYEKGPCDHFIPLIPASNDNSSSLSENSSHKIRCIRSNEIELFSSYSQKKINTNIQSDFEKSKNLLKIKKLIKKYPLSQGVFSVKPKKFFTATQNVSFNIKKAEIISIVGESGSGKSTIAKMIVGLEKTSSGEIIFHGKEIGSRTANNRSFSEVKEIQMIFQNPADVFNPKIKIRSQLIRTINKLLKKTKHSEVNLLIENLMETIRMPKEYLDYLPNQLSGGQKQRVAIARAFAGNPSFVVADEPTSALDVSVQASIVEMLIEMQIRHQNTLLFISHDLSLVSTISDRVIVLLSGQIMEIGRTEDIFSPPYHPYTAVLISANPDLVLKSESKNKEGSKQRIQLQENKIVSSKGCSFSSSCPYFISKKCDQEKPSLQLIKKEHYLSCHQSLAVLQEISW